MTSTRFEQLNSSFKMTNLHFCILLGLATFVMADILDNIKAGLLSNVFLRLYGRNGSQTDANIRNAVTLVPKINKEENLILYISGYLDNIDTSPSLQDIKTAYFRSTNDTVMALDYREIEYNFYPIGVDMTVELGIAVADALDKMVDAGIDIEKLHVIGFSLGAQVAGAVGGNMKHTLPRITGLDPAGPLFTLVQRHLMSTDADFVIVIHGDMGVYGTILQLGHVDFYPNLGRKPQPGCPLQDLPFLQADSCSHNKVPVIYAATVDGPDLFVARNCDSDNDFISGICNNNGIALMGYGTPPNTRGKYYLLTTAQYPYGQGIRGAFP